MGMSLIAFIIMSRRTDEAFGLLGLVDCLYLMFKCGGKLDLNKAKTA